MILNRYENDLPCVDIFVCTADPKIEPPVLVINTVLSVMAYDYPPEKLAVYLSDDAGSDLTFYALLEASNFGKHWLPYCKKFGVEPRSPQAYFSSESAQLEAHQAQELASVKVRLFATVTFLSCLANDFDMYYYLFVFFLSFLVFHISLKL